MLIAAPPHFSKFAKMVRPMHGGIDHFKGTANDNIVYLCETGAIRWGLIVMIRTSPDSLHAVLVPRF
jgi:hypothetical protein